MPQIALDECTRGHAACQTQHPARQVDSDHVAALRLEPGEVTAHPTPSIQDVTAGTGQGEE